MQLQMDDPQEEPQQPSMATRNFSPAPAPQKGYLHSAFDHQNQVHCEFDRLLQP